MKKTVARTLDTVERERERERVYNLINNNKHENALFVIYKTDQLII